MDSIIQMKIVARTLVSNEQGGPLAALQVSTGQPGHHRTLSAVVIHTVACLLTRGNIDLLCPLTTLLTKPGDMAVREPSKAYVCVLKSVFLQQAYLPTMSEDMLPEVRRIIKEKGNFYGSAANHIHTHFVAYIHVMIILCLILLFSHRMPKWSCILCWRG